MPMSPVLAWKMSCGAETGADVEEGVDVQWRHAASVRQGCP